MRQQIDLETWSRKEHFNFFRTFDEPFFGVSVLIDCSRAYQESKSGGHSFYLSYLHKALVTVNELEPFRLRMEGDTVWLYDTIHAAPTVDRPDHTFGYGYLDYDADFQKFVEKAMPRIEQVRQEKTLLPSRSGDNVIHFSSVPWIRFTGISHARHFQRADSIPKITFGKMLEENNRRTLPVSIHVHHGLADGYHVGQWVDRFQELMGQ
ncbi:MAG: chloramphenicol acetyltransferase [Saprospiraceae bacterium]|nr:chloramphenicol acetyltransferase [Saprospiraceae bacterium]